MSKSWLQHVYVIVKDKFSYCLIKNFFVWMSKNTESWGAVCVIHEAIECWARKAFWLKVWRQLGLLSCRSLVSITFYFIKMVGKPTRWFSWPDIRKQWQEWKISADQCYIGSLLWIWKWQVSLLTGSSSKSKTKAIHMGNSVQYRGKILKDNLSEKQVFWLTWSLEHPHVVWVKQVPLFY